MGSCVSNSHGIYSLIFLASDKLADILADLHAGSQHCQQITLFLCNWLPIMVGAS